jgi:hypothetical protein
MLVMGACGETVIDDPVTDEPTFCLFYTDG